MNAREAVEPDTDVIRAIVVGGVWPAGYLRDEFSSDFDRLHMRALLRRDTVQFIRAFRDRIRRGEITTTVHLWQRPHVKSTR